jgi:hypothetical protein
MRKRACRGTGVNLQHAWAGLGRIPTPGNQEPGGAVFMAFWHWNSVKFREISEEMAHRFAF